MSTKKYLLKSKSVKKKPTIKPGNYVIRCDKVSIDEDYVDPTYLIKYTVVNKVGIEISFSERFIDKRGNYRTIEFNEYLNENGLKSFEDLKGRYEMVRIAWNFSGQGRRLPSIIEREFITQKEFETREVLADVEVVS